MGKKNDRKLKMEAFKVKMKFYITMDSDENFKLQHELSSGMDKDFYEIFEPDDKKKLVDAFRTYSRTACATLGACMADEINEIMAEEPEEGAVS